MLLELIRLTMSQLIRMRQRIKAIKTIKKITHALRLISMSTHFRLRSRKNGIEEYKKELSNLFLQIYNFAKDWDHPLVNSDEQSPKILSIIVGSQKGLCGNFNTQLITFFEKDTKETSESTTYITIGKKAYDYLKTTNPEIVMHFDEFTMASLEPISRSIADYIIEAHESYASIKIYNNISKTFFIQKSLKTNLVPFTFETLPTDEESLELVDYIWEQSPKEILNFLIGEFLYISIFELLFQSLIAEQAARFIAMDNSTRSAGKILETMQLQYNKMRQSKITGELTDLVGGFF